MLPLPVPQCLFPYCRHFSAQAPPLVVIFQPFVCNVTNSYLTFDSSNARATPEEGGLGYKPALASWEAFCQTVLDFQSRRVVVNGHASGSGAIKIPEDFLCAYVLRGDGRRRSLSLSNRTDPYVKYRTLRRCILAQSSFKHFISHYSAIYDLRPHVCCIRLMVNPRTFILGGTKQ